MKKLKFGIFAFVLVCSSLLMTACSLFGPSVEKLEVEYTANLQLLVGEEWVDDLIKGTAIYSDDTEKDVTKDMKIDKSDYDKTKVGKYEIEFSYKGASADYEVEVVNKITNSATINNRLSKVIDETFKRNGNVLSFEATKTSEVTDEDFVESLVYVDNNGQISAYTKWTLGNETILEMHYNGTKDSGIETCIFESENNTLEYEDWSLEAYSLHLLTVAETLVLPAEITPSGILALEEDIFAGELTLENSVYTLTHEGNTLQYKDNVVTTLNGAELKFPKTTTTTIPVFTSIQDYMDIVIENTYVRTNGQLEIMASDTTTLQNGVTIEQDIVIQEDNEEYLIYNKFTASNGSNTMSIEYWFEGTLENGTITSSSEGFVASEENKDIEYFMETIYAFQEGLNEEGIDFTIALFPSNLIYLETSEFYGDLTIIDEGMGSLEQEIAEGIIFTLTFMDYEILNVNGVTVVFNDTINPAYIPEIPTATL